MKKFVLALMLLLVSNLCFAAEVTILHTNDIHGKLLPFEEYRGIKNIAGLPRRVTFYKQQIKENKNILILNSGDVYHGSLSYMLDNGKLLAKLIPTMKYDAIALGNHEFNISKKILKRNIRISKTQYLSANLHFNDRYLRKHVKPYIVKEFDGERFLIIGVITSDLYNLTTERSFVLTNPVDEIKNIINTVPHDKVIILSHCGLIEDSKIANSVPNIDLILGGHDHYYFESPKVVNGVPIIQDGKYGARVGVIKFDEKLKSYTYKNMTSDIPDEESSKLAIQNSYKKYVKKLNKVFANSQITLHGKEEYIKKNQSNLGQLILLSYRNVFKNYDYDAIFVNAGSIRIDRDLTGDISYLDVLNLLPFDDYIYLAEIKGEYLKQILESGKNPEAEKQYLQVHLNVDDIEDDKTYRVITIDYLAKGKDGYDLLKKSKVIKQSHIKTRRAFIKTIKQLKTITEENIEF